jgi:hypothetical protein
MTAYVQLDSGMVLETENPELWTEGKRLSVKAGKAALHAEAMAHLREVLKPGDTVYTQVRHVSTSGMSRRISCYVIRNNEPWNISGLVGRVLESKVDRNELSVHVGGCGMDMGFHLVYSLSRTLFRDTFDCVGKDCPSNDHSNGDRDYAPHAHSDGGYALKQRWM